MISPKMAGIQSEPQQSPAKQGQRGRSADEIAGAPRPVLCITEKWIRRRLNLQLNSLESVQSLALPGGYSEKITHLGRSFVGFRMLKHLDLSRNAIESLQGLEYLGQLETLNIYYNNITSLKDLFLLRYNSKLKEIDIRLNPVTCKEPDYRLFLIHMLIHLCKLDERGVVDSERRAALMHFNTAQAHLMEDSVRNVAPPPQEDSKSRRLRADMVQSLAPHSALQDNTDELLELIRRSDHLHTPAKHITTTCGSPVTPDSRSVGYTQYMHSTPPHSLDLMNPVKESSGKVQLEHQDETETYSDFKVNVNFTPAPQPLASCATEAGPAADTVQYDTINREQHREETSDEEIATTMSATIITQLMELLQQYVTTDISFLSRDTRFKGAVCELWKKVQSRGEGTAREMKRLKDELTTSRKQLSMEQAALKDQDTKLDTLKKTLSQHEKQLLTQRSELQQDASLREEMTKLLQQANTDISSLQRHIHALQKENACVRAALDKAPKAVQITKLKDKIGQLESMKASLEIKLSNIQQQQHREEHNHTKLHELTSMLQESHRSLIATNDHLLRELKAIKLKHSQELSQMHQNYQHLKKTLNRVHTCTS